MLIMNFENQINFSFIIISLKINRTYNFQKKSIIFIFKWKVIKEKRNLYLLFKLLCFSINN